MSNNKKVPAHLIEEAAKRGIVPGARIRCARDGAEGTVAPMDKWFIYDDDLVCGKDDTDSNLYANAGSAWVCPATPPPLSDGDACECSETMRKAIVELAGELGVRVAAVFAPGEEGLNDCRWDGRCLIRARRGESGLKWMPPEEFIARMRATSALPKPIRIGEWNVEFQHGSIKVGCTTVPNEVVRKVVEGLKD